MSFRFNEALFKDSSFNERLKQKLSNALNNAFYAGSDDEDDDDGNGTGNIYDKDYQEEIDSSNINTSSSTNNSSNGARNKNVSTRNIGSKTRNLRSNVDTTATTASRRKNDDSEQQRDGGSHSKSDILRSRIIVKRVNFPKLPKFEILDMDIITQPTSLVKGICKIQLEDAMIQLQTVIESNLLLANMKSCPGFLAPNLIENDSFPLPITMTFRNINLEAISNMFVKSHSGVSISFNDVRLEFKFECSLKILQATMEKRFKDSLHSLFKEILPAVLFNMSQNWFSKPPTHPRSHIPTSKEQTTSLSLSSSPSPSIDDAAVARTLHPRVILDENDLQDLSPRNMLRLSAIISSRYTLSLHGTNSNLRSMATISGCLEKQNLCRFISRMPSISNYYMSYRQSGRGTEPFSSSSSSSSSAGASAGMRDDSNALPMVVLREKKYDLRKIIEIQDKLFERGNTDGSSKPHRRVIRLAKGRRRQQISATRSEGEETKKLSRDFETNTRVESEMVDMTPKHVSRPILTPLTTPILSTSKTGMWTPLSSTGSPFASRNTSLSSLVGAGIESERFDSKDHLSAYDTGNSVFGGPVMRGISSYVGIHNHYSHCGWEWGNEESPAGHNVIPPPPYKQ